MFKRRYAEYMKAVISRRRERGGPFLHLQPHPSRTEPSHVRPVEMQPPTDLEDASELRHVVPLLRRLAGPAAALQQQQQRRQQLTDFQAALTQRRPAAAAAAAAGRGPRLASVPTPGFGPGAGPGAGDGAGSRQGDALWARRPGSWDSAQLARLGLTGTRGSWSEAAPASRASPVTHGSRCVVDA